MNVKKWIPLVAAVMLGLLSLVVARKVLTKDPGPAAEAAGTPVVVAKRDVPAGRELSADDLAVSRVAADSVPQRSFRAPADVLGRTVKQPLTKGQAVVELALAAPGARGGLTSLIPDGHRAITVEINEFSGLAGHITPGCRVDVIAILRDERAQLPTARTVLQNIEVRAVGRSVSPPPAVENSPPAPPSNSVTLLVTPRQAQVMQLASQNGRPWLVLRNDADGREVNPEATTLADLLNERRREELTKLPTADPATRPAAEPVVDPFATKLPPAAPPRVVQVIRGGVESSVTFAPAGTVSQHASAPAATRPATPEVPAPPADDRYITGTDPRPAN